MREEKKMMIGVCIHVCIVVMMGVNTIEYVGGMPRRILLDTDVDTDDLFALLYILKLNRSEFDLQAVTINSNGWTDPGHAVNQIYDVLFMMGRDDIAVGVGGEGVILEDGTIMPNVGGYHPIIEQRDSTSGYCRYRQAIPVGFGGRLDIDTNYGFRKSFLPQGSRRYTPLQQPTVQQVMVDKVSQGPITVFIIGANTNFAIFLMSNPHLKKNVQHVYIMGGAMKSSNLSRCCPKNTSSSCKPENCGYRGNLFTDYTSNPYAEFNMFGDPFAAYQVIHSGIPITLVPLDATNTIPITMKFFDEFEKNQRTYEAQYCFMSLKMTRDTRLDGQFFTYYYLWDSFLSGVATSIMLKNDNVNGDNDFSEMEHMNITVITSNQPYGVVDASNPFFYGLEKPKFGLDRNGVHSGHVQTGLRDPFCIVKNDTGNCKDGYTPVVNGDEGVGVLVSVRAKPSSDRNIGLEREFFKSFLDVLNREEQTAKFNFTTQFPHYREVVYMPDFKKRQRGKSVVFDMDMSAGDFLALFYLLKTPVEVIDLKAILVTPTGWANAATIDVVYDLLHMMGRDDIPVGLGDVFALNQSDLISPSVGDCKYKKAIPQGSGGLIDSDTLYGLARDLPRSSRRFTAENSVKFGAPRDTDHPELRQPLALETWRSLVESLEPGSKITILTNGPLTNTAKIILLGNNLSSPIQDIFIVGGHLSKHKTDKGNVINIPSNEQAELNMFLDPLAAKTVFDSRHNITLIPLNVQRTISRFSRVLQSFHLTNKTPELLFSKNLVSRLHSLKMADPRYDHVDVFLGEVLGAVVLAGNDSFLRTKYARRGVKVMATGTESEDGVMSEDEETGNAVRVLEQVHPSAFFDTFANRLADEKESAVIGSFEEQKKLWSSPQK